MSKDDGGSAFPGAFIPPSGVNGMSLRDYFAAAALTGLVQRLSDEGMKYAESNAYAIADRMLAERAK